MAELLSNEDYLEQYSKEGNILFQQVHGIKKTGWRYNSLVVGEYSFKSFMSKIADIQKSNMISSPDPADNQQYTWQVSAVLWYADCQITHEDTILGKILDKMPFVSITYVFYFIF